MITNKDIRVENGNLVLNGDKFPLDGQSPETIMEIVEDNSDTTPTENSTAPITSGGVFTALGTKQDTLTFDTAPTAESTNPVTSGGVYSSISAINSSLDGKSNILLTELVTIFSEQTINAGAEKNDTFDATKSGYSLLGVVGWYTPSTVVPAKMRINGQTIEYRAINVGSSAVSNAYLMANCLYVKS